MMEEKLVMHGYLSRTNIEQLQAGIDCNIRLYKETELHHRFGDKPEENAVEVCVTIEKASQVHQATSGMSKEKCLLILKQYREVLVLHGAVEEEIDYDQWYSNDRTSALNYCLSMLPQMERFIKAGRREKFFRWLGWAQGVLWSYGIFSLNDLHEHNRPPEK